MQAYRATSRAAAKTLVLAVMAVAVLAALAEPAGAALLRRHKAPLPGHATPMSPGATDPNKDAALIMDGATGKILYARNETLERHPASLTKMMTLYLLFDALKNGKITMQTQMPVSRHATVQIPTKLFLKPGQVIDVDTAIRAMVIRSANDAAVVVAEALGGTETHFAEMMTQKAREIGMKETYYHNASGVPDPLQITTASDLAILAHHLAYDFPQYFSYFGTPGFTYKKQWIPTHDNLIGRYAGTDGIKTGYVDASGFNIVTSVVRDNVHLIGVVMGGRTAVRRDLEMMHLMDNEFAEIAANPALVARAPVPWRNLNVAAAAPPSDSFSLTPVAGNNNTQFAALSAVPAPIPAGTDEESAEAYRAPDETYSTIHAEEPQLASRPAPAVPNFPAPSARPQQMASAAETPDSRSWNIQIGVFGNQALAEARLNAYAVKAKAILGEAAHIVAPMHAANGHVLYRARFGPYAERQARDVCGQLTQRGQACFPVVTR